MNRGDIIDVFFPYSDLNQVKLRPGLVVQSNTLASNADVVIACITGNLNRSGAARVTIRLADPDGPATNLKTDSVILADKLATVDKKAVRVVRGVFRRMDLVDAALRYALDL